MHPPGESDIDFLQTSCQLASLILERHQMNEELIYRAYHDPLTGLGNRRLGKEALESAIQRAQRDGRGVGVLWIDLDKFKEINEIHGHPAGDFVLREMAHRLMRACEKATPSLAWAAMSLWLSSSCMEARDDAERVASELLKILAQPIHMGETQLSVSASIGISAYPGMATRRKFLSSVPTSRCTMQSLAGSGKHLQPRSRLKGTPSALCLKWECGAVWKTAPSGLSINHNAFPRENSLHSKRCCAFSIPNWGAFPPTRLIPIAEETQLILPIGRWVLKEVCRQLRAWQQAGFEVVPIAVNISSIQFARHDFSNEVAEILAEAGVHPSLLELELTESLVMRDFAESARQMQKLKDLGVRIAIDDFGTGYSSLSYLHRLPIDTLKIDRSFVEMITEPEGTRPIVDAVISMAQAFGLRVVGEGVETVGQMEALCHGGCDMIQGNLFSRPVSAEQTLPFLRYGQVMAPSILNLPKTAA